MTRTVQEWFEIIQAHRDDDKVACLLLADLAHYSRGDSYEDLKQVIALFAAIRLDQMVKENA